MDPREQLRMLAGSGMRVGGMNVPQTHEMQGVGSMIAQALQNPQVQKLIQSFMGGGGQMTDRPVPLGPVPGSGSAPPMEMRPDPRFGGDFDPDAVDPRMQREYLNEVDQGQFQSAKRRGDMPQNEMRDEDMLETVRQSMDEGGGDGWEGAGAGKPTKADIEYLQDSPTDGNISDFIRTFGKGQLPPDMGGGKSDEEYDEDEEDMVGGKESQEEYKRRRGRSGSDAADDDR